jgi:hypothetical protein
MFNEEKKMSSKMGGKFSAIFFECRQIFIQSHKEAQTRPAAVAQWQNTFIVIPRLRVSVLLLLLAPGD